MVWEIMTKCCGGSLFIGTPCRVSLCLWRTSITTSDIVHMIDIYQHIKEICLIVILLHDCYIKIYAITSPLYSISYFSLYIVISSAFCRMSE